MVCNEHSGMNVRVTELERRMGRIEYCIIAVTVCIIVQLWNIIDPPKRMQGVIIAEVKAEQAP